MQWDERKGLLNLTYEQYSLKSIHAPSLVNPVVGYGPTSMRHILSKKRHYIDLSFASKRVGTKYIMNDPNLRSGRGSMEPILLLRDSVKPSIIFLFANID